MIRTILAAIAATIALTGCSGPDEPKMPPVAALAAGPSNPRLDQAPTRPAPTTVSGYRTLFRSIDPYYWGAGDVSISLRIDNGNRVWLYGDTTSLRNGFVHSTAIVQDGGNLRVSRNGEQLLPNGPTVCDELGQCRKEIYWIEAVRNRAIDEAIVITAAPISVGTNGMWDFRRVDGREHQSRLALATVSDAGDVTFERWLRWDDRPLLTGDGEDFRVIGEHHFTYQEIVHDIRLEDGTWLKTICQGWDDPLHVDETGEVIWNDYRPMWRSSPTPDLGIEPQPHEEG